MTDNDKIYSAHIAQQFKVISSMFEFEPVDQFTADGIEAMMESMLHQLLQGGAIYDYQTKSTAVSSNSEIYTSVIFQSTHYGKFLYLDFTSHVHTPKDPVSTADAFDRAMKGI